jgi:hypothetical protein
MPTVWKDVLESYFRRNEVDNMKKTHGHIKLENPRNYAALMLFFGCLFEILGTTTERFTANSTLSQAGWYLIVVSALLWTIELVCRLIRR